MANKMATLLGTSFSTNEKMVTQADAAKFGSIQQKMVVRFDQQAFEGMLFEGSAGPIQKRPSPKKARKEWKPKTFAPPQALEGIFSAARDDEEDSHAVSPQAKEDPAVHKSGKGKHYGVRLDKTEGDSMLSKKRSAAKSSCMKAHAANSTNAPADMSCISYVATKPNYMNAHTVTNDSRMYADVATKVSHMNADASSRMNAGVVAGLGHIDSYAATKASRINAVRMSSHADTNLSRRKSAPCGSRSIFDRLFYGPALKSSQEEVSDSVQYNLDSSYYTPSGVGTKKFKTSQTQ